MSDAERAEHDAFLRNQMPSYGVPTQQPAPVIASPIYEPAPQPLAKSCPTAPADIDDFQLDDEPVVPAVSEPSMTQNHDNTPSVEALPDVDDFMARFEALKR